MTTKRAPVRLQKPVKGPLNRISQAHGPEPDGSAMWAPWGEKPGDVYHDVLNLSSLRTVRARNGTSVLLGVLMRVAIVMPAQTSIVHPIHNRCGSFARLSDGISCCVLPAMAGTSVC